jgi:hypothetical protein
MISLIEPVQILTVCNDPPLHQPILAQLPDL